MKPNQEKKTIIILGGGFAGVRAALDLSQYLAREDEYEVIVIDRKDYLTYYSALYEAATTDQALVEAKKVKRSVIVPHQLIFGASRVKVFKAYIESINLNDGKIITDSRILSFDYLVVAMGSISDFYGIPGLEKYSFTLKSLEDAIMIRNRVADIIAKKDHGTIIIGGGGFAGTEFAGELYNLLHKECIRLEKNPDAFQLLVVEGATTYLPGLPEKVSQIAAIRLASLGIKSKFSTLITEVGKDFVVLNKTEKQAMDLLVWTGGVRSCKLPMSDAVLDCDKKDRLVTTDFLNLKKYPHVFIAGDNSCFLDPVTKKPVPQTAQEAIHQGKLVARNLYRIIRAKPLTPYQPTSVRFVVPVSGKSAIFYTPYLILSGFSGYVIRRLADLRFFLSILPFGQAIKLWFFENNIFMKND